MIPVLYVQMGGLTWQVFEDGSWSRVPVGEPLLDGIQIITQDIQPLYDAPTAAQALAQTEEIEQALQQTLDNLYTDIDDDQGQVDSPSSNVANPNATNPNATSPQSSGGFVIAFQATLDETIAKAGFNTRPALHQEQQNNSDAGANSRDLLPQSATISVHIQDEVFSSGYLNQFEIPGVTISGTTTDIRDGRIVTIVVSDSEGNQVQVTAQLTNNSYQASDINLDSLVEGELTVTATISDDFGNAVSAQDQSIKDTKAFTLLRLDGFGDDFVNQVEADGERVYGLAVNVEHGQPIQFLISDEAGNSVEVDGTVGVLGTYVIRDQDISGLQDGTLTVVATTIDLAGNPATSTDTIIKDTAASITVQFDGFGDEYINLQESSQSSFYGTTSDVEAGQTVTLIVKDINGSTAIFTTQTAADASYRLDNADLTGLADGVLTVEAIVTDIAGNIAIADDTKIKDTQAEIAVNFDGFGDDELGLNEIAQARIFGTVNNIEAGQVVTLTVSDNAGTSLPFQTVTSQSGRFELTNLDLSSLQDGDLTVTATVVDVAGNPAQAQDEILKDTKAAILVRFDGAGDNYLNADEVPADTISGLVVNVEVGQVVELEISDTLGARITLQTTVAANRTFSVSDVDLSRLAEGELTVEATTYDLAGNPASNIDTIIKDTLAEIAVAFDGRGDNYLNQQEIASTLLFGQVQNVEVGQVVTLQVTDINGVTSTTTALVTEDGSYQARVDLSRLSDGELTVVGEVEDIAGNHTTSSNTIIKDTLAELDVAFDGQGDSYLNLLEVNTTRIYGDSREVEAGQTVTLAISDEAGNVININTQIGADGSFELNNQDLSSLTDGELSVLATVTDIAGNTVNANSTIIKDTAATITVQFDGFGDEELSAFEVAQARLFGQTVDVEAGQLVTLTIADQAMNSLTLTAVVSADGGFQVEPVDLSALQDGALSVTASVEDIAGNRASAQDDIVKDTQAALLVRFNGFGDDYLNAQEVGVETISGITRNIEPNQIVTLTVTDSINNTLTFTTTVNELGLFSLSNLDLSSLAEGELSVVATASDLAGNSASGTDTIIKDTQATITVHFEGNGDEYINLSEASAITIFGRTDNIEAGQQIQITIRDSSGNRLDMTTESGVDGSYQFDNIDVTGLTDGDLTVETTVSDIANNLASASDLIVKDTLAAIEVQFDGFGDQELSKFEISSSRIFGSTSNIEAGQTITLQISDAANNQLSVTTQVLADGSYQVEGLDLSGLVDGELTVVASVEDVAGNPVSADNDIIKDTKAFIFVNFIGFGDGYLNADEVQQEAIVGLTKNIEAGQPIALVITDSNGATINLTSEVVDNGGFVVGDLDLSGLAEGELTIVASAQDIAGNDATYSDTIIKDTLASITVDIDGLGDNILNADESISTTISGQTQNIEVGQKVSITVTDSLGQTLSFDTTVAADSRYQIDAADLSTLVDGELTIAARSQDIAGNSADALDTIIKDVSATIMVEFDGFGDQELSRFEVTNARLFGQTDNVETGQTISLTVTDSAGASLDFTTQVLSDGSYQLNNLDFSGLEEGELSVTASVIDIAGNSAQASDAIIKDTKAGIIVRFEGFGDNYLNATEVNPDTLFGSTRNIEANQTIALIVSDSEGQSLTFSSAVAEDGSYRLTGLDFSSLAEGELSVVALVQDLAGNIAQGSDTIIKDTLASIEVAFDSQGNSALNMQQSDQVTLFGQASNVEAGQAVLLTVTDSQGAQLDFTTSLEPDGRYQLDGLDLSSLADGQLTVTAQVSDIAGNIANANNTISKDTQANIRVHFDGFGDNYLNSGEVAVETLSGNTRNVEPGQTVSLLVSDTAGNSITLQAVTDERGFFQLTDVDLSSLNEGILQVTATVTDVAGNSASSEDFIVKDTLAHITVAFDGNGDDTLNNQEVAGVRLFGQTQQVELGQTVQLSVTDSLGVLLLFSASVQADGSYEVLDADLSSLADGLLVIEAMVSDIAGNSATANNQIDKDTLAQIQVSFDGQGDDYLNRQESVATTIFGSTTQVEQGQQVELLVSDSVGNQVTLYTTVTSDGSFTLMGQDLSSLQDGQLLVSATVTDTAGNQAAASNTIIKDTQASITVNIDGFGDDELSSDEVASSRIFGTVDNVEPDQSIAITVTDRLGNSVSGSTTVASDGQYQLTNVDLSGLVDGELQVTAQTQDIAGNLAQADNGIIKDTLAKITVQFDGFGDEYLNQVEVSQARIFGQTVNIEAGQSVNLTVQDRNGISLDFTTIVESDGSYQITDSNLSLLSEGELTVTASASDLAGNSASAQDSIIKDTRASIDVAFEGNGDRFLNSSEIDTTRIFGQTQQIEAGQSVTIVVTDQAGSRMTFDAATDVIGRFELFSTDLSALQDGELTVTATATDIAGNTTSASNTIIKDTLAAITVEFEGNGDEELNASEIVTTTIQGTVNQVEDGQSVMLTVTDSLGAVIDFTTSVVGGQYQIADEDFSSLAEGQLQVTATVIDVAGNEVSATDTIVKDTKASIAVRFDGFGDEYLNLVESQNETIFGVTRNIEAGQSVTLLISDSQGSQLTLTTTTLPDGSFQIDNQDLTALADGELTVIASATDLGGNVATGQDTIIKDTKISITLDIEDGGDGILNDQEVAAVTVFGEVFNVEDGQTILVTLTSQSRNFFVVKETVVNGNSWSISDIDGSQFWDGTLVAFAEVKDIAGNRAEALDTGTVVDTENPKIDIDTLDGFSILDFRNGDLTHIQGTTEDVEAALPVTVLISDGTTTLSYDAPVDASGDWFVTGIDVSTLDRNVEWTIEAQVTNAAGNSAQDDMPTIVLPDSLNFTETVIGIFGEDNQQGDVNIRFAQFSFFDQQTVADDLTSEGQSLSLDIQDSIMVATRADGEVVFVATLADDKVDISFQKAVDQGFALNSIQSAIIIKGTQFDADGSTEEVLGHLAITIQDSEPVIFDESYQVTEGEVGSGNVLNNDIDLDGELIIATVTVAEETQLVTDARPAVFELAQGQLTVFANGHWNFSANRNLDHNEIQSIEFSYLAGDSGFDFGSGVATIEISDGAAGTIGSGEMPAIEANVGDRPQTLEGSVQITAGSDNIDANSLKFTQQSIDGLEAQNITIGSPGDLLSYSLAADGQSIEALSSSGQTVFSISLAIEPLPDSDNLTARFTVELDKPLNHIFDSDTLVLPLQLSGTDLDGTPLELGQFDFEFADGRDPLLTAGDNIAISEDDLVAGPVVASGDFTLDLGSDLLGFNQSLNAQLFFDISQQASLTSNGEVVRYTIDPTGAIITGYVGESVDSSSTVFVMALDQPNIDQEGKIGYGFSLFRSLDQTEQDFSIPFVVVAKDQDGDRSELIVNVAIEDATGGTISSDVLKVTEQPRSLTTPVLVDGADSGTLTVSASLDTITYIGLDVNNGDSVIDSSGNELTKNGEPLSWRDNGDGSFDAVTSDNMAIFRITLPSDFSLDPEQSTQVEIKVEMFDQVDHGLPNASTDTLLALPLPVLTVDSDGTRLVADSTLQIYDGRQPRLQVAGDLNVDEDGLIDDNQSSADQEQNPTILVNSGSDDFSHFELDIDAFNDLGYTSGGQGVSLTAANSDGWYFAYNDNNKKVFKLRIEDDAQSSKFGQVKFVLFKALDHADNEDAVENNLELSFIVSAVDADGDSSTGQLLTVNVKDSIPEPFNDILEITEGDDFSGQFLDKVATGADGGSITLAVYDGKAYTFDDTGSLTIDLANDFDGTNYGTLTLNQDGSFTLKTNDEVTTDPNNPVLNDSILFYITDADGDEVISEAQLILDDSQGFIRTFDAETVEDERALIEFYISLGDIDQNEQVLKVEIDESSLSGGTLLLNGQPLMAVDGVITIAQEQLVTIDGKFVAPAGILSYQPALNQSNTTANVALAITATIATTSGVDKVIAQQLDVSILPVADVPDWQASNFEYAFIEDDSDGVTLDIEAALFDTDGSETLSYKITAIPDGITIILNGTPITEGSEYTQEQLDQMKLVAADNLAGEFSFNITAIATEAGNNFADDSDETAQTTQTVTVKINPDADKPEITVRDIQGVEDQAIDLNEAMLASLADTDGSESLIYEVVLPSGWSLIGSGFTEVADNTYWIEASAVENSQVQLMPKTDISSVTETLSFDVTAIAQESTQAGLTPINEYARSDTKTINIHLRGVVDEPTVQDGGNNHWQLDGDNNLIQSVTPILEDSLIALDFSFITTDDDQSEVLNVLLTDIPEGARLVDSSGEPVVLSIAGIDPTTGAVYQVSNDDLMQLYIQTDPDFSGRIEFKAVVTTTESDGDSASYSYTVQADVAPVVDQKDGQIITTTGIEDRQIALNLAVSVDQDSDGSETLTGYIIDPLPTQLTLYFDGSPIEVPASGLDLTTLLDTTTPDLNQLISSGRLAVTAAQDLSGEFQFAIRYAVTDISETGAVQQKEIAGIIDVVVEGKVELDTRLVANPALYESDDGSAIDVSDAVEFIEEDIDGSEIIDYLTITLPQGYDFIVKHPNGASQTADGSWIIDGAGLTSDVVQDATEILSGMTIRSYNNMSEPEPVVVRARVLDGEDARFVDATFDIFITGISGGGGTCPDIEDPGDIEAGNQIEFDEGTEVLDLAGLLDPDIASNEDNQISFYIPAETLPDGVELQGDGVVAEYDRSGDVIGYSISQTGLSQLQIVGLDEDFAGCLQFEVETTETSSCSGDSVTSKQTIHIDILPVVDEFNLVTATQQIDEDQTTQLDLRIMLGDSIGLGQAIIGEGDSTTGKETINWLTLEVSEGGALVTDGLDWISDNGDGSYTVSDPSRLNELQLAPEANFSGDINITATANITDSVDCLPGRDDTQTKTTAITINVAPVVDSALLVTDDITGHEDSYISLSSLQAELVDIDGSESLSVSLTGVPEGAVVAVFDGSDYQLLPNNGTDGSSINGLTTYEWQLEVSQLAYTFILPPLDFSGDIPLTLSAITQEQQTGDVSFTKSEFTLGVKPVGDDVTVFDVPTELTANEDSAITIDLNAESSETRSDEFLELTVVVKNSSDPSALEGLDKIKAGFDTARFVSLPNGSAIATLNITASTLASFELYAGDAFGEFDVQIALRTFDSNTVLGRYSADLGEANISELKLTVTPEPDEPILTSQYQTLSAHAEGEIDLGLSMALINPASNEVGTLVITGVPSGLELSHGSRQGSEYWVDVDDVDALAIVGGYSGEQSFELILTPSATIEGNSVSGLSSTLQVELTEVGDNSLTGTVQRDYLDGGSGDDVLEAGLGEDTLVGGAGSDSLTGGLGSDTFVFSLSDVGTQASPAIDTITDFNVSADTDAIDLSQLLIGINSGAEADQYIDLDQQGDDLVINIKPDSTDITQSIVLRSTTVEALYGGDTSGVSEADILQKMIDDHNLIVQS